MPWNGSAPSQTYGRTDGTRSGTTVWAQAQAAAVPIDSPDHDTHDQDIATALNLCLKKDGGNTPTANIPMGSNKFTGLADGSVYSDSATFGNVMKCGNFANRTPSNVGLSCAVAGNNLTITVTAADGTALSATDPAVFPFRSTTYTSGAPVLVTATSPISFTINNGNTMGSSNSTPFRMWIVGINNAGTVLVGAINVCTNAQLAGSAGTNTVYPIQVGGLASTGAGSNGGSTIGTIYTSSPSLTNKAICVLGYVEYTSGLANAGVWTAAPDVVMLAGPDVPLPGRVIQTQFATVINNVTHSGDTNFADVTGATVSMTPVSASNLVRVSVTANGTISLVGGANTLITQQLLRGSTALISTAGGVSTGGGAATQWQGGLAMSVLDAPQTTSSVTYKVQHKTSNSSATATTANISITLDEIMC